MNTIFRSKLNKKGAEGWLDAGGREKGQGTIKEGDIGDLRCWAFFMRCCVEKNPSLRCCGDFKPYGVRCLHFKVYSVR